ncbi:retention module-containing protein, partial [Aeromonas sp. QDB11]|uniref:retention module-containing protein n=1 Tax=Aeromonas sp. QDB11 TaxID=2990482 RepID=UPI0022E748D0
MITNAVTLEQGVTVTQLKGQIYLVAADGSRKLLAEGDVLPKGAVIMSPDGASFMGGGQSFTVQPASEQSEPAEEGDAPQLAQNGAAGTPDDINALQQAILGGADPTQAFEASAAGGAPAAGGGGIGGVAGASGNGGFVTIDRTGSATIAEATFDTTYNTNGELPLGAAGEDEVFDLTPPTISVVAPDNTNDTTPTLTGTTDAPVGNIVTLLVTDANGNQQTLTATVTPAGTFTVDVVTPLAEGSYTVTATVTDPAGNSGSATDSGSVDVTAPVITVDAPDNTNDTTPTITGTTNAVPGSTVTLVVTDANGTQQTLTVTVQSGGGYSVDVTTPLAEGSYTVTATVTDPAGNTGNAIDQGSVDPTTIKEVAVNNEGAKAEEGQDLTFKVALSAASEQATSHSFSLAGVSAGEGDFDRSKVTFSNGVTLSADGKSVLVPAGVSSFTVTVPTINDSVDEADETLKLAVGGKDAIGTIVDNDALPTIKEVAVNNEGAKAEEGQDLTFKVTLSAASEQATSHSFSLAGVSAGEGDFDRSKVTFSNGVTLSADGKSVLVPAGVSSFTVTVPTINDSVDEADETLKLAVGGKDAIGTIVDNDALPTIKEVAVNNEGAKAEEGQDLTFKVTL